MSHSVAPRSIAICLIGSILPAAVASGQRLPVVYLLHGGGGGFRDWSNFSDVAGFAESGLILVMPEGASSYYVDAVDPPEDRFEDYIVRDLIADVETRFPAASGRSNRAIVGLSMGGFGAVTLALRHPDLFGFVGAAQLGHRCSPSRFYLQAVAAVAPLQRDLWAFRQSDTARPRSISAGENSKSRRRTLFLSDLRTNRKACCLQTVNSPRCWRNATSTSSSIR